MNKCIYSEYCGGCQLQGMSYNEQLKYKQNRVEKLLGSFHKINPVLGMKDPFNYRNKVQVTFGYNEEHHIICGNYVPKTHYLLEIKECMITDDMSYRIIDSIKRLAIKYRLSIFSERTLKGVLRHVVIRTSNNGEYMVVLVCGTSGFNNSDKFVKDLVKFNPMISTVVLNLNNRSSSQVLGPKSFVLYGKGYITDTLCGLNFRISAESFYQVNKRQTEVLYNYALNKADLNIEDTIIDAYCGTGTIGLSASKKVKEVLGVELNQSAVNDAIINKKINSIKNARFICEDAGKYMEYLASNNQSVSTVIMDPPRSGSDMKFMKSLVKMNPEKVVYISCNPVSLADNLRFLTKYYEIRDIQPVDMFPFTEHIEVIALLTKK